MNNSDEDASGAHFVNLTYCLWLPAGKDEFGFDLFDDAPLSRTALYRRQVASEDTISAHFEHMAKRLRTNNVLASMETSGSFAPMDGELGLRKIHFGFTYHHNYDFGGYLCTGPIHGNALFLSNGVYLWSFRMPLKDPVIGEPGRHLKEIFRSFLRDDFVSRHIGSIFSFGWNPGSADGGLRSYSGVLTYYQLDLLFNGVFDQSAHPHLALGERPPSQARHIEDETRRIEDEAKECYDVEYLVRSFSLCVLGNEYTPLFDQRKSYTLRRTHGDQSAHVDTSLSLTERTIPADQEDELHRREIFLSRLSFAAMEQFLRVAISFGLVYYKTGLDHIRAELISQSMERRKNQTSGELRRPSLSSKALTLADMEAYYALLAGKVPTLSFVRDLVKGMSEVSRPTNGAPVEADGALRVANGVRGAVEWRFSQETLKEARTQFERQVNVITADLAAIQSSLDAVRSELMLLELTEARKLSEIAAETPRSDIEAGVVSGAPLKLDSEMEKRFTLLLTFSAAVIAVLEVLTSVGLVLSDKAFQGGFDPRQGDQQLMVGYWLLFPVVVIGGVWYGWTRLNAARERRNRQVPEAGPRGGEKLETHVFDYSSLSHRIGKRSPGSAELMRKIQAEMVDIEDPSKEPQRAARFSTFHEIPSGGIERIKYSLESQETASRLTYILHVEFDRRINAERDERLLDIRLVVRRPLNAPEVEIAANSRHVIGKAVERLLSSDMSEADMRVYTRQHFGWEWPLAPGASM